MTEKFESNKLIELVIEKHNKFLGTFNTEFSELDNKMNAIKQQSEALKKEKDSTEIRITVLNEKYFLLFHQAKKQRDETFFQVIEKIRGKPEVHDIIRLGSRIEELEKKLQNSKNIDDEEKTIAQITQLFFDFENASRKTDIIVNCKGIIDKLNEANSSHKELISLQNKPKQDTSSNKDFEKQIEEIGERHNWLKRRIESHTKALDYWQNQKGG